MYIVVARGHISQCDSQFAFGELPTVDRACTNMGVPLLSNRRAFNSNFSLAVRQQ